MDSAYLKRKLARSTITSQSKPAVQDFDVYAVVVLGIVVWVIYILTPYHLGEFYWYILFYKFLVTHPNFINFGDFS